jgi:SpoVK/Ycf46/Vps4 family AAA+-type ATPase
MSGQVISMKEVSEDQQKKVDVLIRARYPLIYITTWEEERVAVMLNALAVKAEKQLIIWSTTEGFSDFSGRKIDGEAVDPFAALTYITDYQRPAIFMLKDFHPFMKDPVVIRKLRDLKIHLSNLKKTCILVSPVLEVPIELEKMINVVDFNFPTLELLDTVLEGIIEPLKLNPRVDVSLTEEEREAVLKSALELTVDEAENVFAKSLVEVKRFDPAIIIQEKEQIIRKSGILEYYHSNEHFDNIGGLEHLKEWLSIRNRGFTEKAREYGLPFPSGLMLIGIPGTGKSLTAQAVASLWKLPLLRFDVGKVFGGVVGESERNIRQAIKTAESVSPSILWIDEIEKGFAGVQSSNLTDAGTTSRVFGTFITWLQEKKKPVFVIATANNVNQLPPELMRKGRFDEIFFLDLPSPKEREDIFSIHIKKRGREIEKFDIRTLVGLSKGYSGAEIEQTLITAMFDAFSDDREVETTDIMNALEDMVPLSRLMKEDITSLRTWAQARARLASKTEQQKKPNIEIEV